MAAHKKHRGGPNKTTPDKTKQTNMNILMVIFRDVGIPPWHGQSEDWGVKPVYVATTSHLYLHP